MSFYALVNAIPLSRYEIAEGVKNSYDRFFNRGLTKINAQLELIKDRVDPEVIVNIKKGLEDFTKHKTGYVENLYKRFLECIQGIPEIETWIKLGKKVFSSWTVWYFIFVCCTLGSFTPTGTPININKRDLLESPINSPNLGSGSDGYNNFYIQLAVTVTAAVAVLVFKNYTNSSSEVQPDYYAYVQPSVLLIRSNFSLKAAEGIIIEKTGGVIKKVNIKIKNIVISSSLSLAISNITFIISLFIFAPQHWLKLANILALLFNI